MRRGLIYQRRVSLDKRSAQGIRKSANTEGPSNRVREWPSMQIEPRLEILFPRERSRPSSRAPSAL